MRASNRSLKGLLALLVLGSLIVPSAASALPPNPVSDVIVFGNHVPDFPAWGITGDPGWNDPNTGYDSLFAISKPLDQVSQGAAYYMGVADPDIIVDIEVTDGVTSLFTSTWTAPAGSTPAIDGYGPGWFGVGIPSGFPRPTQSDRNEIVVTGLGVHEAETDTLVNPDGSASTNPDHWGGSTLTFKFTARNPITNETAATVERELTKYAGTPDDVSNPGLLPRPGGAPNPHYPPAHWCHTGGLGANFPTQPGQNLGGTEQGQCSSFAQAPFGAVPDLTWILCTQIGSNPHHILVPTAPANPFRGNYCRRDPNAHNPHGEAKIQAFITDATNGARGLASEIADVSVKVFRGSNLWLDLTSRTFTARQGPQLQMEAKLGINELPNNWPQGELYQVRLSIRDAWGNTFNHNSPNITVYPY